MDCRQKTDNGNVSQLDAPLITRPCQAVLTGPLPPYLNNFNIPVQILLT